MMLNFFSIFFSFIDWLRRIKREFLFSFCSKDLSIPLITSCLGIQEVYFYGVQKFEKFKVWVDVLSGWSV